MAQAFGACSPNTTWRNEITATAVTDAMPPRVRKFRLCGRDENQVCDGVLRDVAEQDRGDGDAELRGGELAVEVLERLADGAGFAIAAADQGFDPCATRRYEGEFGRHEKCVRRHEHDDGDQAQAQDVHGLKVLCFPRGHTFAPR